jgi:hypothetical protein
MSVWGSGPCRADVTHTVTEDRDGLAGAVPSVWGFGGHVGAHKLNQAGDTDGTEVGGA